MPAIRLHIPALEIKKLQQTIGAYAQALGRDATTELLHQGQLLVKDLIKTTPPKKASAGKKRVEKDINKAVKLVDPDKTTNRELKNRLKELQRQRDYETATKIYEKSAKLKNYDFVDFSPSIHKKARRKGGITFSVPEATGKATLEKRKWKDYNREVQSRVGTLKASWLPAADKLFVKTAKWISKHAAHAYSVSSCDIRVNDNKPTIYIRNRENGQVLLQRIATKALQYRQRNMVRDLERRLKQFMNQQARKRFR